MNEQEKDNKRVIAINLPQFHPFKENDEWWGKGFTEWTNVTKAKPRYWGHYQPQLPTDTGFYDLRLPEAREMQAEMAKEYGIYGFCYYHYWFNGHLLMEKPLEDMLQSKTPDFPFMLCWANENWARNWDGGFSHILIEQKYALQDDREHMEYLCSKYFCDSRYIRVDNKPVFVIYKPHQFPQMAETIKVWRETAKKFNMELYLMSSNYGNLSNKEILNFGFDAVFDFQPAKLDAFGSWRYNIMFAIKRRLNRFGFKFPYYFSYKKYVEYQLSKKQNASLKEYPCVSPGWDNSPRRVNKSFVAFKGNTPELFEKWFSGVYSRFKPFSTNENFIFINAWNEWAEGNHLEPDRKWGRKFLVAVRNVIKGNISNL